MSLTAREYMCYFIGRMLFANDPKFPLKIITCQETLQMTFEGVLKIMDEIKDAEKQLQMIYHKRAEEEGHPQ
jgi:hypothetical protein